MQEEIDPPQPFAQKVLVSQSVMVTHVQLDVASQKEHILKLLSWKWYGKKKNPMWTQCNKVFAVWCKAKYLVPDTQKTKLLS